MREFARLLYLLVIVLPLTLLLIGPLLILAALRGMQHIGPIVLNPGRRGAAGRVGALLLGLVAWLAIWGGLAFALAPAGLPGMQSLSLSDLLAKGAPAAAPLVPSPTAILMPSPSASAMPVLILTPSPSQPASVPGPSATPSVPPATATRVLPVATATPLPATPTLAPTVTSAPGSSPAMALAPQPAAEAIAVVEQANELLSKAAMDPSISNLAALETVWQDRALAKAQAFAQQLYQEYPHPLQVTFVYLSPPTAQEDDTSEMAVVTTSEAWTYTAPRTLHTEAFEFIYALERRDQGWVIINYTYRNAPNAAPTATLVTPAVLTNTTALTDTSVITPAGSN
jgi:hypothetical protein